MSTDIESAERPSIPKSGEQLLSRFTSAPWVLAKPGKAELALGTVGDLTGGAARLVAARQIKGQLGIFLPPPRAGQTETPGDPGLFGPDSIAWRVFADAALVVAGTPAVVQQGLLPKALYGFADHTDLNGDPMGRLTRTAQYLMVTTYGDTESAHKAIRYANGMHRQVTGDMPDGGHYEALDPELLMWVHLAVYMPILAAYQRFGPKPLTDAEVDQFVAETAVVARLFGVDDPPTTWADCNEVWETYRKKVAMDLRAAKVLTFFAQPVTLPWASRTVFEQLWAAGVVTIHPYCRALFMQPEPTARQLAQTRLLVRSLQQVIGEPEALTRARRRLATTS